MSGFDVRWVILCDSINQFMDGKYLLNGVYTEDIVTDEAEPSVLPAFTIGICLKPLKQDIVLNVELSSENSAKIIKTRGEIHANSAVEENDRVLVPIAIPPSQFPGFGRYIIKASDDEDNLREIHSFRIVSPVDVRGVEYA